MFHKQPGTHDTEEVYDQWIHQHVWRFGLLKHASGHAAKSSMAQSIHGLYQIMSHVCSFN